MIDKIRAIWFLFRISWVKNTTKLKEVKNITSKDRMPLLQIGGVEFGPVNPGKNFRKCIFPEPGSFLVLIFTRPTLFPVPVKKLCFFQQIFTVSGKHSVAFNFCHCQSNWEWSWGRISGDRIFILTFDLLKNEKIIWSPDKKLLIFWNSAS